MADWKTIYQERNVTAEEAISYIKSGDSISVAHVGSEPFVLLEEMVRQAERLRDVHLYFLLSLGIKSHLLYVLKCSKIHLSNNKLEPCFS